MKKHDKDWVAVAEMVPGRTHSQCREPRTGLKFVEFETVYYI
jgi:hypothetical protein